MKESLKRSLPGSAGYADNTLWVCNVIFVGLTPLVREGVDPLLGQDQANNHLQFSGLIISIKNILYTNLQNI